MDNKSIFLRSNSIRSICRGALLSAACVFVMSAPGGHALVAKAEDVAVLISSGCDESTFYYDWNELFYTESTNAELIEALNNQWAEHSAQGEVYCATPGYEDSFEYTADDGTIIDVGSDYLTEMDENGYDPDYEDGMAMASDGMYYFTSSEAVNDYVKKQLVNRSGTIVLRLSEALYNYYEELGPLPGNGSFIYRIIRETFTHTEECSGQEGDSLYWNYSGAVARISSNSYYRTITYEIRYKTTFEQEQELTEAVNQALEELDLYGKSEFEIVTSLYFYIGDMVDYYRHESFDQYYGSYDYSDDPYGDNCDLQYTAYAAMCEKVYSSTDKAPDSLLLREDGSIRRFAVCEGYALLFYRMCKELGVSARLVPGNDVNGNPTHGWNIVKIGEYYYNIDVTWDGQTEVTETNYFLKNTADFKKHTRSEAFDTADFNARYPIAPTSMGSSSLPSDGYNYINPISRSYNSIDGDTVSTSADGKAKVLLYYSAASINSTLTVMQGLKLAKEAGQLQDIDFVFVEMKRANEETVSQIAVNNGGEYFSFCYDEAELGAVSGGTISWAMNDCSRYLGYAGVSAFYYPVMVYIDADNRYQYLTHGSVTVEAVISNIETYCRVEAPVIAEETYGVVGNSMTIGDGFTLNYYVNPEPGFVEDADSKMVFVYGYSTDAITIEQPVSEAEVTEVNYNGETKQLLKFTCEIPVKDMERTIYAYLMDSQGECSPAYSYSAKEYVADLSGLKDVSEEALALARAMLNYGYYSQAFFDYRTEFASNSILSDEDRVLAVIDREELIAEAELEGYRLEVTDDLEGIDFIGARLELENRAAVKLYFEVSKTAISPDDISILADGLEYTAEPVGDALFCVELNGFGAAQLGAAKEITVTYACEKSGSISFSYCPMTYVYSVVCINQVEAGALSDLVCAMYEYYKAAGIFCAG